MMSDLVQPFSSYLNSIYIQSSSKNTLFSYRSGLKHFTKFVDTQYHWTIPDTIAQLKEGKEDLYKLLNEFVIYLVNQKLKPKSIKLFVGVVKGFLRHTGIKIYDEDFRQIVKLPKVRRYREEPLTKELIVRLLRNIPLRFQAAVLVAVASGMRVGELVQLKISDIDFDSKPTKVKIRAETTKTRESRETYITEEATKALKDYLSRYFGWNLGESNQAVLDKIFFGPTTAKRKKDGEKTHTPAQIAESVLRCTLLYHLKKIPDLTKLNENGSHVIHFHAFRKYFYTTVSNVVGSDFAHALMGHHGYLDTYYNLPEEKRRKMYLKAEPYLTISDYTKIEKSLDEISEKYQNLEQQFASFKRYLQTVGKDCEEVKTWN